MPDSALDFLNTPPASAKPSAADFLGTPPAKPTTQPPELPTPPQFVSPSSALPQQPDWRSSAGSERADPLTIGIQNPDTTFPQDEQGYTYGSVLPYRKNNQTGAIEWSPGFSEAIRAPARGLQDFWARMHGPLTPEKMRGLNPDEQAAFLAFGGLSAAANRPPVAPAPEVPIGGLTRAEAGAAAKEASSTVRGAATAAKTDERAATMVGQKLATDLGTTGQTPAQIAQRLAQGRALGKPLTITDVAGPNVRGLAGTVAREPGDSSTVMSRFYEPRDTATAQRLKTDVARDLAQGPSARRTSEGLMQAQTTEANPIYERAYEGGSVAPLEKQFEYEYGRAVNAERETGEAVRSAEARLTAARARQLQAADDVYANSGANRDARAAEAAVQHAREAQSFATQQKELVLQRLREAQEDRMTDAPGAVWNPRIEQLMKNPDVRRGLPLGLRILRNEADAAGVPFNPTEYALKTDAAGNILTDSEGIPIVRSVPNMRLLDAAKKGMDATIEANRDPNTGRLNMLGRSVNELRRVFLPEIDRINPTYAEARASWAGHAASMDAVNIGRKFQDLSPEELTDAVRDMTPGDREFLRIGVADVVLERIKKAAFSGDESKAVINNLWREEQLHAVFPSEQAAQQFIDSVAFERLMFDTRQMIYGNSQTIARKTQDAANKAELGLQVAHGAMHALSGSYMATLRSAVRLAKYLGLKPNDQLNAAVARILSDPEYTPDIPELPPPVLPTAPPLITGPTAPFPPSAPAQTLQP